MCIIYHLLSYFSEVSRVVPPVLLQWWKQGEVNYLRVEVNSTVLERIFKQHSWFIALYKRRGHLKYRVIHIKCSNT